MGSMHPDLAILETHFGRQVSLNIEKASKEFQNVLKEKKLYLKERKKKMIRCGYIWKERCQISKF